MQDSVDSEAMHSHSLHHRVAILLEPIGLALRRVAQDNPSLLMGDYLAYRPILGEAAIALIQLLNDPELLALCDAGRTIAHSGLTDVLHVHVLQHDAVEANGELLLGEVGLSQHCDL